MTIKEALNVFYNENDIPNDGGVDDTFFIFKVFGLKLKLPNPEFRRKALYIHDIQHVVHGCDTSWKGESFIAGWEISTKMWKHIPIGLLGIWAMGYGIWLHPREVLEGYKKGLLQTGIIDLDSSKKELLSMEISELEKLILREKEINWEFSKKLLFIGWILTSQLILLGPFALSIWIIIKVLF